MHIKPVSGEDLLMISDLIDGCLSGARRSEALRRIEADEALYEVFVETARFRTSPWPTPWPPRSPAM